MTQCHNQTQTSSEFSSVQLSKDICIAQLSRMSHCAPAARKPVRFKFTPEARIGESAVSLTGVTLKILDCRPIEIFRYSGGGADIEGAQGERTSPRPKPTAGGSCLNCTQHSHMSELRPIIIIRLNVCLCTENQMVMYNYSPVYVNNTPPHAIHMHGHAFAVMYMGYKPQTGVEVRNNPDIVCDSPTCAAANWNKSRDVYVMQS